MKALAIALVLAAGGFAAGQVLAQGDSAADGGAVCRSFCDVDSQKCRKESDRKIDEEHHVLLPVVPAGGGYGGSYDFAAEKRELASRREGDERLQGSRACAEARQACRQKCVAPVAAPAASSTPR